MTEQERNRYILALKASPRMTTLELDQRHVATHVFGRQGVLCGDMDSKSRDCRIVGMVCVYIHHDVGEVQLTSYPISV